ncbi:MAG: putative metalloprotease CJM1_0395 family protein [Gallionellaceae bacterium]|nr:putative metalloprotease CJM1_0395 family protein [Gallionellaceae bacterium]
MPVGAIGGSAELYALQYARPAQVAGQAQLTPEQQQQVVKLKQVDQKVREHEAAHLSVGAGLTSGASYQYARGPDGKQYAVAGEVKIDVSPAQTAQQTLDKARRIQAAALAPADPSSQDRAVAAQAAQMAMQAQIELSRGKNGSESSQPAAANPTAAAIAAYVDQEPRPAPTLSLYA